MIAEARFLFLDTNIISQKRMDRDESCQRCWAHITVAGLLRFNASEAHPCGSAGRRRHRADECCTAYAQNWRDAAHVCLAQQSQPAPGARDPSAVRG